MIGRSSLGRCHRGSAASLAAGVAGARLRGWMELTKPGITASTTLTAVCGYYLAPGGHARGALGVILATALLIAGAGALNQLFERETDGKMPRTRGRPLPSGVIDGPTAAAAAALWSIAGVGWLTIGFGWLPGVIGAAAWVLYVLVYTPLKRVTPWAFAVGALAGAAPPVIGFAASGGGGVSAPLVLFVLFYAWQIPHFLAVAIYRGPEYRAAGLAVALDRTPAAVTFIQWGSWLLLGSTAGLAFAVDGGWLVSLSAAPSAVVLALVSLARPRGAAWARRVFVWSLAFVPSVGLGVVIRGVLS